MRVSQRARLIDAGITTCHDLAGHDGPVPELSTRDRRVADRAGPAADHRPGRRQAAVRGDRRAAADGAARPRQGRSVLRLRGRSAVDGRRPRMGAGVPVGRADRHRRLPPVLGARPRRASGRRSSTSSRWSASVARRYPEHAHLPLRGLREDARCCDWPDATASARTRSTTCFAKRRARRPLSVGAQEHSGRHRELQPQVARAALHGQPSCAPARSPPPPTSITEYARYCELRRAVASTTPRSCSRRSRTTTATTAGRRAGCATGSIARAIESRGSRHAVPQPVSGDAADSAPDTDAPDRVERTLLKFAGDGVEARTPEQTAVAMFAAARGYHQREDKPFWWGAFRPAQQSRRRVGRQQRRLHRRAGRGRRRLAHCPRERRKPQRWVQARRRHSPPAHSPRPCTRCTTRRRPPASATIRSAGRSGTVEVTRMRQPRGADRGHRRASGSPTGATFTQLPFALTPGPADQHQAAAGVDRPPRRPPSPTDCPTCRADAIDGHSAAPTTAHPSAAAPLPRERHRRRDITGRTARPRLVVPRGARTAGHRQDLHCGAGHRHASSTTTTGGSASSHSRTPSSRTCSRDVISAGVAGTRVAKKDCRPPARRGRRSARTTTPAFIADHGGCVIGGTAWDFANDNRVAADSLDLLVIEEAGQFSLANTIAVARAARNLTAARRSAAAAAGQPGHPPRAGRRLRARLAGRRAPHVARRTRLLPGPLLPHAPRCLRAGVAAVLRRPAALRGSRHRARGSTVWRPGSARWSSITTATPPSSPEEAAAIVAEIGGLIGTAWTDEDGTRPLAQNDVLVVTPYNAQVAAASAADSTPRASPTCARAPSTSSRDSRRRWCSSR